MLSLRTYVIILAACFATLLIIGWGGAILQSTGAVSAPERLRWPFLILMCGLLLGIVFSAIPVMVMLVLGAQKHIGNEDVAAVAALIKRQNTIIYVLWALIGLGSLIAIPAAILGGAFNAPAAPAAPGASGTTQDADAAKAEDGSK